MAKLSLTVMAHSKRAHLIPALVEQLGIYDDQVIWDRKSDRWDTGRRAWEAHDPEATHHCVVQDDALICQDFIAGMEKALEYIPNDVLVSPYIGTRRPSAHNVDRAVRRARELDPKPAFITMPSLNWGVGILAPVGIIEDMLPWCDKQNYPNYDRRIGRYAIDVMRMGTWCTYPSLMDHRTDEQSLIGHGAGRVAHDFIGEDASALDIDFSTGSMPMIQPAHTAARRNVFEERNIARKQAVMRKAPIRKTPLRQVPVRQDIAPKEGSVPNGVNRNATIDEIEALNKRKAGDARWS